MQSRDARRTCRTVLIAALGAAMAACGRQEVSAPSGFANTQAFGFTGQVQTFVVPAGLDSLVIAVSGAGGGGFTGFQGGFGGLMTSAFAVSAGDTLYVIVGGGGGAGTGVSTGVGGGGGGGSFVFDRTTLLIAAGGGGGGG
ncbi:MAG TPA: hypothetical protein VN613_06860, partial [Gemmatimonadaceae bacterium]|nr:hypothetical protein [Gemmatimonadaceae bacterium]